jgi:hypothetical protein
MKPAIRKMLNISMDKHHSLRASLSPDHKGGTGVHPFVNGQGSITMMCKQLVVMHVNIALLLKVKAAGEGGVPFRHELLYLNEKMTVPARMQLYSAARVMLVSMQPGISPPYLPPIC